MSKVAKAWISWVPAAKGGRKKFPTGPTYCNVVHFRDDPKWPGEAWSLVIRKVRSYRGGRFWFATIEFLMEDAPHELLHAGARFSLHEGKKLAATGLVRSDNAKPPAQPTTVQAVLLS
jgi:hypothetical protein